MSNIYIQEPPTKGKVILKTTLDEIAVELWSKECPKTCRNFIQLCMEGYYDGTIFHRVIKDFIAQGGDPTGTGQGGESIYGAPFKDEFHQRLRFNRRGLLGMANSEKDDNGSQFFFTLGNTPELNKKHTLFGKISDNTIFNMIKINEIETIDERPTRAVRILSTEVIYNPFDDIKPRNLQALRQKADEKERTVVKGVKNFGLLSFGDEAEDEEEELESLSTKFKSKSAHDIGDPTLLAKKVIEIDKIEEKSETNSSSNSSSSDEEKESRKKKRKTNDEINHSIVTETKKLDLENIKSKLKKNVDEKKKSSKEDATLLDEKELKIKQTQDEIKKIQKELASSQKKKLEEETEKIEKEKEKKEEAEIVLKYKEDKEKYEHLKKKKVKNTKEDKTLELLNAFRNRLFKAKTLNEEDSHNSSEDVEAKEKSIEASSESDPLKAIFNHRLELDEEIKQKVIDANIADNERYDIYDPRNPLNKRKLEESRNAFREKKGHSLSSSSHSSSSRSSDYSRSKRN